MTLLLPPAQGQPDIVEPSTALQYVEQDASQVNFFLLDTAAPRHLIRVLAERRLCLGAGEITLAVIGSSHFMEIRVDGQALTEMLACPTPDLARVLPGRVIGERDSLCRHAMKWNISYRSWVWREALEPFDFEKATVRLSEKQADRLSYTFPTREVGVAAITCLDWRLDGRSLAVRTYHTFPDQFTIVHSRSVVGLPEKGAVA